MEDTRPKSVAAHPRPITPKVPCLGLCDTHEYIKELGKGGRWCFCVDIHPQGLCRERAGTLAAGGTGETFLYRDKQSGEQVAVKLIRRPLPKVIQANILREIMVRTVAGPLPSHITVVY